MKPQLSVLLVEDDPNVRLGCEQAMQLAGIAVDAVASAEEAQRRLTAGYPGIVRKGNVIYFTFNRTLIAKKNVDL